MITRGWTPPPQREHDDRVFRPATIDDLSALRDLERAASQAALAHVFPPEQFPYPDDDVLARWALVLDEPGVTVIVLEDDDGLAALAAYDDTTLRHLAIRPDRWGDGLGTTAIAASLNAIGGTGCTLASLWCLEENHRARRLYEHLGWDATTERREAPWPPFPMEMLYTRTTATLSP